MNFFVELYHNEFTISTKGIPLKPSKPIVIKPKPYARIQPSLDDKSHN